MTYYDDIARDPSGSFGKLKTLRRNDGYWEKVAHIWNPHAKIKGGKTYSPWLDSIYPEIDYNGSAPEPAGAHKLRSEIDIETTNGMSDYCVSVGGVALEADFSEKRDAGGDLLFETTHRPHAGGDAVREIVRYRNDIAVADYLRGKPVSRVLACGMSELYTYDLTDGVITETFDSGYGNAGGIVNGVRTISKTNYDTDEEISVHNYARTTRYETNIPACTRREIDADGQIKRITSNLYPGKEYAYAPSTENGGGLITTETTLLGDAASSFLQTIRVTDLQGNVVRETVNGATTQYFYAASGASAGNLSPDDVRTIRSKDCTHHELAISGVDLNGDGVLDPADDSVRKTEKVFDYTWPENVGSWKTTQSFAFDGNFFVKRTTWKTADGTRSRTWQAGVSGFSETQNASYLAQTQNSWTTSSTSPAGIVATTTFTRSPSGWLQHVSQVVSAPETEETVSSSYVLDAYLDCETPGAYMSFFTDRDGGKKGIGTWPGINHTQEQDNDMYGYNPSIFSDGNDEAYAKGEDGNLNRITRRCLPDCIDSSRAAGVIGGLLASTPNWDFDDSNCADMVIGALSQLISSPKPKCKRCEYVYDYLSGNGWIALPSRVESIISKIQANNCNRYVCRKRP